MMHRWTRLVLGALLAAPTLDAQHLLVPMDDAQRNHLKAYGLTYSALQRTEKAEWLLNYRGGAFLLLDTPTTRRRAGLDGVSVTALAQFASLFRERPELGAAFGAYDLAPEAPGIVSQYRNLLHHYVHATSAGPAITFWAGCGAVRRTAFVASGGFDAERYRRPQIEDIELGYRLTAMGYPIVLRPEIQGMHLKRWTIRGGMVTDVRDRGVPWMELLLERRELAAAGPLNLRPREKWLTLLAPLAAGMALGSLVLRSPQVGGVAVLAFVPLIVGNLPLIRWFALVRGWRFAVAIVPLRLSYYLLNSFSAAWAVLHRSLRQREVGSRRPLATSRLPS